MNGDPLISTVKSDPVREYPCWLVKQVLLNGRLVIDLEQLYFSASLDKHRPEQFKSGFLWKQSSQTYKWPFYWAVLSEHTLTYYDSIKDCYSPRGSINLRNVVSVQISKSRPCGFKLLMANGEKSHRFLTDTKQSQIQWLKALDAAVFYAHSLGDQVKIVLPIRNITDVQLISSEMFPDALRIRITDFEDENHVSEEYYFSYFTEPLKVYQNIEDLRKKVSRLSTGSRDSKTTGDLCETDQSSMIALKAPIRTSSDSHNNGKPGSEEKNLLSKTATSSKTRSQFHLTKLENLRKIFPELSDSFSVLGFYPCYLISGVLPKLGNIILGNTHVLFLSRLIGVRTRLIVPIVEIQDFGKQGGRFLHGVWVKTQNETDFWFEFRSERSRIEFMEELVAIMQRRNLVKIPSMSSLDDSQVERQHSLILDEIHQLDTSFETEFRENQLYYLPMLASPRSAVVKPTKSYLITCLTIGTRGDVQPFIALCKSLMSHGHRCRIATHEEYRGWIESHGIEFRKIGGNPADLMQLCVDNGMFTLSFIREVSANFRDWIVDLLETAWEACHDTEVLIEAPSAMAGHHIAEKLNVPYFAAFTMPWTATRDFPHPFAIPDSNMGAGYNVMTWVLIEQLLMKGTQGFINRWRKNTLKMGPMKGWTLDKLPFLYNFSPSVVPPPRDWGSNINITGYWFLDDPDIQWAPPKDLVEFIGSSSKQPLVYIGFGSVIVPNPDELTNIVRTAARRANVRAIISKGWSARKTCVKETLPQSDAYAYFVSSVPHDWLFPKMDAVVHHGGAGTTSAGLRFGVPTVIKPFFGDQYFWAGQIQDLGVGLSLRELTVESLTVALQKVTSDVKIKRKAKALAEKLKTENGLKTAVTLIHSGIEYHYQNQISVAVPRRRVKSTTSPSVVSSIGTLSSSPLPSQPDSYMSDSDVALNRTEILQHSSNVQFCPWVHDSDHTASKSCTDSSRTNLSPLNQRSDRTKHKPSSQSFPSFPFLQSNEGSSTVSGLWKGFQRTRRPLSIDHGSASAMNQSELELENNESSPSNSFAGLSVEPANETSPKYPWRWLRKWVSSS